jgi:hypothetical protein
MPVKLAYSNPGPSQTRHFKGLEIVEKNGRNVIGIVMSLLKSIRLDYEPWRHLCRAFISIFNQKTLSIAQLVIY